MAHWVKDLALLQWLGLLLWCGLELPHASGTAKKKKRKAYINQAVLYAGERGKGGHAEKTQARLIETLT